MEFDLLSGRALSATRHMSLKIGRSAQRFESSFAGELRKLIHFRRKRDNLFGADLFADPVWDMMLDLCLAAEVGRPVSVSSLCMASAVPPTTALRWIKAMEKRGLLTRQEDPHDRRRFFVSLAPDIEQKLHALLRERFDLPQVEPASSKPAVSELNDELKCRAHASAA